MTDQNDRQSWLNVMERIARPVLEAGAAGELRARLPVKAVPPGEDDRAQFACLEAVGRLLCGIAPWLELDDLTGDEEDLRAELANLARRAIANGVDPDSYDYFNFEDDFQPIVDGAFLAQSMLRAPTALWAELDQDVRGNVCRAMALTRTRKPGFNNWLLFGAMIEALLHKAGVYWDPMRVDYALRQHMQWYLGDGVYGDGPDFHMDYYNSFVIQPMLIDVLAEVSGEYPEWAAMALPVMVRSQRYAAIQERLISPEGTFPPIGRSLAYRFGVFQTLGQMALFEQLPAEVSPAQVRCALTAVITRMANAPDAFDEDGWLRIGFCGNQPDIGETYISMGSIYLCAAGLLPLGLPRCRPLLGGSAPALDRATHLVRREYAV